MTKKHSVASTQRWVNIPKDERSSIMSSVAHKRWAKVSKKDRRIIAMMMVRARKAKQSMV